MLRKVSVLPATVGQYTGLTDKNGQRIFEGDVVKITDIYNHFVIWDVDYKLYCFCVNQKGVNFFTDLHDFPESRYEIEVIGNIHDNPELMEE